MATMLPAVSLAAVPGRRRAALDLAREIERRGFSGIYCPSFGDGLGLCEAIALATERIRFGTSIANIYLRHVQDYAQTAALVHELSGGRFAFGIGVSHGPALDRMGVKAGAPLADTRAFVAGLRAAPRVGELPPIVLATLRKKMVALAGEVGDGMVFANAARSTWPCRCGAARRARERSGLLHRRHDPDLHLRRRGGRRRGEPEDAGRLRLAAQLPQLLARGRLSGRDGPDREGGRRAETSTRFPSSRATAGSPTSRSTARCAASARARKRGSTPECARRSWSVVGRGQPDQGVRGALQLLRAERAGPVPSRWRPWTVEDVLRLVARRRLAGEQVRLAAPAPPSPATVKL